MNKELEKKEELKKLLDIDFFQKIQDKLSNEFGIASIITDIDGNPLTKPSNFSSFCMNYVRSNPKGLKNCKSCDAIGGFSAQKIMKPVIYTCHTGLTDFASPIIVDGELVGCFLCGQILTNDLSKEHFENVSKKLGLNRDNLNESLNKLKVMPLEKVEYFANFLFKISTKISNFSHYQKTVNSYSKTLEDDFNSLFSILINKNSNISIKEKIKLLFSNNKIPDTNIINRNIEILEDNLSFTNSKIKSFTSKLRDSIT